MPTYQYACTACDERLEAVQSFSDAALTECPACGGSLRKVFSAVGVVFKGSGFYKTDSRAGSGTKSEAKADASTSSDGGSSGKADGAGSAGGSSGKQAPATAGQGAGAAGSGASAKPTVSTPASKSA